MHCASWRGKEHASTIPSLLRIERSGQGTAPKSVEFSNPYGVGKLILLNLLPYLILGRFSLFVVLKLPCLFQLV